MDLIQDSPTLNLYPHLTTAERLLPKCVRDVLVAFPIDLILAGGYLRSVSCGERPHSDHDLFLIRPELAGSVVNFLGQQVPLGHEAKWKVTPRAATATINGHVVQLVLGWNPASPMQLVHEFDFTVCKAAMWYGTHTFVGCCTTSFLRDISQRALVWDGQSDAISSIIRLTKFMRRGFTMSSRSLVGFISACVRQLSIVDQNIDIERTILRQIVQRDPSPEMVAGLIDDTSGVEQPTFEDMSTGELAYRLRDNAAP